MSEERIDIKSMESNLRLWGIGDISDEDLALEMDYMVPELKRCYEKIDKMDEAILSARELLMSYFDAVTLSDDEAAQEILDVVKELRKASE